MPNILYANNAAGTLAAGITNVATTLTLNAPPTAFPVPVPPQVFYVTLTDAATQTLIEIVKVTAVAGNIFSIVRGQDGTTPLSWNTNDIVSQRTIALELRNFQNAAEGNFAALATPVTPATTLGIVGTTLADNANAGSVGEVMSSTIPSGSGVPFAPGGFVNVTSLFLTPGDWDVFGFVGFNLGSPTVTYIQGSISMTSNASNPNAFFVVGSPSSASALSSGNTPPPIRVNISVSTAVFLVATALFTGGTMSAYGSLTARRRR